MKNNLEFCFMGNCQLCVIGWALKMMNPDIRMFWIAPLSIFDSLSWSFRYLPNSFMLKNDSGKDFLSKCDVLLYNHINPNHKLLKSWCSPHNTKPNCKKLSITSMYYKKITSDVDLTEMIKREKALNTDICTSEVFQTLQRSGEDIGGVANDARHHHSNVYRKLIPHVAKKLKLNFDYEIFDFLSENNFPFNKSWARKENI
jgi:hypothetical protein